MKNQKSKEFIKDLHSIATKEHLKNPNGKWNRVYEFMSKKYPNEHMTKESLRTLYRYYNPSETDNQHKSAIERREFLLGNIALEDKIISRIKKKIAVDSLAKDLQVDVDEIYLAVTKLQLRGYSGVKVWIENSKAYIQNVIRFKETSQNLHLHLNGADSYTFGLVSDQHLGSEYCDEEALENFYDICEQRGITDIYSAGDSVEGFKAQRVETFLGNKALGFQAQLEYFVKNYPKRKNIKTYMISGNHTNWYLQQGLANIDKTIAMLRDDIVYLGHDYAKIHFTDKVSLTLYHPNDGSSSNVFSKVQNFIDRGMDKVGTINVVGHYHKCGILKHRGVWGIYPASFQRNSEWMNLNNLKSYVGAWIITVKFNKKGELISLNPEYIDYDDSESYLQ